jgi:hypothetical protein
LERKLIKAGIYGLIIGVLFSILYYPDVIGINTNGGYTSQAVSMRDYIFKVLRTSIKICFASIIAVCVVEFYKSLPKDDSSTKSTKKIAIDVIKSFLIGTVLFLIIFYIIGILTHN